MLTSRIMHQAFLGGTVGLASFSAFHWRAMGGNWQRIRQILSFSSSNPTSQSTNKISDGGDLFEIDVPTSHLLNLNRPDHDDDPIVHLTRAFFTAPFFTLERCMIDTLLNKKWPNYSSSGFDTESFQKGSQHALWTVVERSADSIQLQWGFGHVGGTTNLSIVAAPNKEDLSTLQFGSRISARADPTMIYQPHPIMTYLHEQYSNLLLAQAAHRLQTMASTTKMKSK